MSFPKAITPYLGDFLSCGLAHLQQLLPTFSQYYLSLSSPSPPNTSEDEPMGLSMLACPVLDFISSVVRGGKAKAWLQPQSLEALIVSGFGWIQMTEEDVGGNLKCQGCFVNGFFQSYPGGYVGQRCKRLRRTRRRRNTDIQLACGGIGSALRMFYF